MGGYFMKKTYSFQEAKQIFDQSFMLLLDKAHAVHKDNFDQDAIQISTLLSIKTGGCPENCSYCPQSAHFNTGIKKEPLMEIEEVVQSAKRAKEAGSTRFCMGAAWRGPRDEDLYKVCAMVGEVKKMGLETCVTLGLLKKHQAVMLKESGLDFYNHNIDTSPEFYQKIITTRCFEDRIQTLEHVRGIRYKNMLWWYHRHGGNKYRSYQDVDSTCQSRMSTRIYSH